MKSSMTNTSHSGMIIIARFHLTSEKKLKTDEIEHDENVTHCDDYRLRDSM